MSIQALRERLTTVTWRPTYRELEAALAEIAALERDLKYFKEAKEQAEARAEAAGELAANLCAELDATRLRANTLEDFNDEWERRAEEAQAEVVRLTNVLTRIRDERGVRPYDVAREALRPAEQPDRTHPSRVTKESEGFNDALTWAANWIENSATANGHPAAIEFAKNMAMTFRAALITIDDPSRGEGARSDCGAADAGGKE